MKAQRSFLRRIVADTTAATAIEYALIAAVLALGMIAGAKGLGVTVTSMFELIQNKYPTVQ